MAKSKKAKKQEKNEDPLVADLKKIFGEFLLSVCKVEFTKEPEEGEEAKELSVPQTEEEIVGIVNDLVDEKAEKLMKNYKGKKVRILPLGGLWQSCYDQKYDLIRT
ncbi:hypothetical protein COS83_01595, partial [archaeon CG07_land_8_20_14_0_80_38_8]